MRAAIYARYSSDLQSQASIEDQMRLCRTRIEAEGWSLVHTYTDPALSGASRLRPGYQKLLEDARAGTFDIVVAEGLDRLSRDQEDTAALYKQLGFAGVRLMTLAEGEISELHVGLKGTLNALFLKGRDAAWKAGCGRDASAAASAMATRSRPSAIPPAIRSPAAATSTRARPRSWCGSSVSTPPASRRAPSPAGSTPGPGGRPLGDTTIRGHALRRTGLLHNDLYIGRLVWNRQRHVKDPETGRRVARLNPENAWVVRDVPELRIVDDDLWQAVQARLAATRQSPGVAKAIATEFWKHRRARHLLTGLAHCGVCGKPLAAVGRDYLACGSARRQGMCDNRRAIRREVLESVILDALRSRLMQPDLVAEFAEAYQQEVNRQRAGADAGRERTARELAQVERKLAGLVEAIAGGLRAPSLQQTLDNLEQRRAELTRQLASTPASLPRLHPNVAEVYRRKVTELGAALRDRRTEPRRSPFYAV